jgi:imidazoleglycerol phosphate dehydratase HisB
MANQFKKTMETGIGTNPIEVYTTGASTRATVIGINIANTTNGTIQVSIKFRDDTSAEGYIVKDVSIAKGTALAAMGGDQKLVLEPNNFIVVVSNTENSADVIVSALEITT